MELFHIIKLELIFIHIKNFFNFIGSFVDLVHKVNLEIILQNFVGIEPFKENSEAHGLLIEDINELFIKLFDEVVNIIAIWIVDGLNVVLVYLVAGQNCAVFSSFS